MSDASLPPALSVVIVRFVGGDALAETLLALEGQQQPPPSFEVLCVTAPESPIPGEWRERHPSVHWIEGPPRCSPARLRSLGVSAARGTHVACTEDHCVPAPDWCARIVAAHAGEPGVSRVVGGAIDKRPDPSTPDGSAWAAYLLDYSRYMPPFSPGPAQYASDCNVSYVRAALENVRQVWEVEFHETSVHDALAAQGIPLRLDPTVMVFEHRPVKLWDYLRERGEHGALFARTRLIGASPVTRVQWFATSLLLPPVLVMRAVQRVRRAGQLHRVPARAWPPLVAAAVAWSLGEVRGYLAGRAR
ncbi:MAG: glycosyltransferase [Gemmatimonadaceae bacterium]